MDKMLAVIIIFLTLMFTIAGIIVMGAVPKIFQSAKDTTETKKEAKNQTAIIINEFERESNKTNKSLELMKQIIDNQELSRKERDIKNEETLIIIALLNHETRQLIKLGLDQNNITNYHDPNFLNKRHHDFPFYFTNKTHVTIELDENTNRSIAIPYEMSNLLMQFNKDYNQTTIPTIRN